MPQAVEHGTTQEDRGKINGEASRLIRRLDNRLEESSEVQRVAVSSWLSGLDFVAFTVREDDSEDSPKDTFRIERSERSSGVGKWTVRRRLEIVSDSGNTETTRRLVMTKSSEPSPESGLIYFRRKKVEGKVVETVTLKDLKAVDDAEELIDSVPSGNSSWTWV